VNIYACKCGHRWDEVHIDPAGTFTQVECSGGPLVEKFLGVPYDLFKRTKDED
jgi:hypothetical protein